MRCLAQDHRTLKGKRFPAGAQPVLVENTCFPRCAILPLIIGPFCESAFPNSRETCNEYLIQCHGRLAYSSDQ